MRGSGQSRIGVYSPLAERVEGRPPPYTIRFVSLRPIEWCKVYQDRKEVLITEYRELNGCGTHIADYLSIV